MQMRKKRCFFAVMALIGFLALAATAMAQDLKLPSTSMDFAPDPQKGSKVEGVQLLRVVDGRVRIQVPIMRSQYTAEKLSDPKWQVNLRFVWQEPGGNWEWESRDSYARETRQYEDFLEAWAVLPKQANLYRIRIWIPAVNISNKWAWINASDPCAREDEADPPNLAYELVFNEKGEWAPVPSNWPKWPAP
jgi:hypothetical protein